MAFGLRCRDNIGNTTVYITDRLTRVLGVYTTTPNVAGALPVPGSGDAWFAPISFGLPNPESVANPSISKSGNTIMWPASVASITFVYGLY